MYESVADEFADSTNPISKPNSAWICHTQLKLWPFCDIFAHFGQNLVARAFLPLAIINVVFAWMGRARRPSVISNNILAIFRRNAFIAILVPHMTHTSEVVAIFCDIFCLF